LTQEELAEKSQVNLRTIQRIENSESEPRGKTLQLICEALNIEISELTGFKHDKKSIKVLRVTFNILFLVVINLILMGIIGFLTLDSNANINSRFGGFLVSFLLPIFIVQLSRNMSGVERLLKFGVGYLAYLILVVAVVGFPLAFLNGLIPCLVLSISILYYGNILNGRKVQ
jgi:DNA-binding XRE family transcriptional regulator